MSAHTNHRIDAGARRPPAATVPASAAELRACTPAMIAALSEAQVLATRQWMAHWSPSQLGALKAAKLRALLATAPALSAAQINAVPGRVLASLSVDQLRRLRTGGRPQNGGMPADSGDQNFLTAAQVLALPAQKFRALVGDGPLSIGAIAVVSPAQAAALGPRFYFGLSTALLRALRPNALAALGSAQRRALWGCCPPAPDPTPPM